MLTSNMYDKVIQLQTKRIQKTAKEYPQKAWHSNELVNIFVALS
jgi:hypothetical protein